MPTVKDCEIRDEFAICTPEESVVDVAKFMVEKGFSSSIVVESNKPVGIVTVFDIVKRVVAEGKDPKTVRVVDVMTSPVLSVNLNDDLIEVSRLMVSRGLASVPVVNENGELVGILTLQDIARMASGGQGHG